MNSLLKLSERELDVLANLIILDINWSDLNLPKNIIDVRSRKILIRNMRINRHNLSSYITKFKRRSILVSLDGENWIVNPDFLISPLLDVENELGLVFLLDIEDE
jgi:hypothetical protein